MPRRWPQHSRLRAMLVDAIRRGDLKTWEAVARSGIATIPGDGTWHYNLACALSLKGEEGLALTELERAVKFGFRDAKAIEADRDLENVRPLERYREIVAKAREWAPFPVAGRPVTRTSAVRVGGTVTLDATNTVWNMDEGLFHAQVKFTAGEGAVALSPVARNYRGPVPEFVCAYLSEGTAAGNVNDVYVNRDNGHSALRTGDFPYLSQVRFGADARAFGAHVDFPNIVFPETMAVLGNASRARLGDLFWRSLPRMALTDGQVASRLDRLYLSNQLWFFPAHKDFGAENGDVFSAVAPFQFVSVGSSYTDQPFLRAALAASAALPVPTKREVLARRLFGPTVQWLLRRSMKGIVSEEDYLSPRAHPTAFAKAALDEKTLVVRAHLLHPEQIPPAVGLLPVNSRLYPIPVPQPGADYPDVVGEYAFATATAIGIVLRSPVAVRTFLVRAQALPAPVAKEGAKGVEYAWRVVHGDAWRVKFETPFGETFDGPERGFAQIKVDRRGMTNRIDVACFARTEKSSWGAPSFVSFAPVPREERKYAGDGRCLEIDFNGRRERYADPMLSLVRKWKDVYDWAPDGRLLGFRRFAGGREVARFDARGRRIAGEGPDGAPKTVPVRYVPRSQGPGKPNELTWVDAAPGR